jgi:hypothetical protein
MTDVRDWAREQGMDVKDRGRLPKAVQERFDAEHAEPGQVNGGGSYDGGVTEADFPAAAAAALGPLQEDGGPATEAPAPATARRRGRDADTGETRPRAVRKAKVRKSFRERVWGGDGTKPDRPKTRHPRMSLKGLAEDTFLDLAWAFQHVPPVEKVLYLEAPLAGEVLDKTVRGTAADRVFQPIARANAQIKGFEALTAPLWVALIMARGRKDENGAYSPETVLMFGGLRHALLSLTRSTSLDFDQLREKSEELRTASGQIDRMIEWLFEVPEQPAEQAERTGQEGQGAVLHVAPVPAGSP